MLYKPLFIVCEVKGLLKKVACCGTKMKHLSYKVGVPHAYQACIKMLGFKLQCR